MSGASDEQRRGFAQEFEDFRTVMHGLAADYRFGEELFNRDWKIYFATEDAAPAFFGRMASRWMDHLIVRIAAVLDPPGSGQRQNLSLHMILERAESVVGHECVEHCNDLLENVKSQCEELVRHRQKVLAHIDYQVHSGGARSNEIVWYRTIQDVINAIFAVMNQIEAVFQQSTTAWDQIQTTEPHDMVKVLYDWLWVREVRAKVERGDLSRDEALPVLLGGRNSFAWDQWCAKRQLDTDHFLRR